jgi:hypothetical protein
MFNEEELHHGIRPASSGREVDDLLKSWNL